MIWVVFLLPADFSHIYNVVFNKPDFFQGNLGVLVSVVGGLLTRFFAIVLAMAIGFKVWGRSDFWRKARVETLVETALFLEGTYFVLLFPSGLWWLSLGFNFLGLAYVMQAAIAGCALFALSFNIRETHRGGKVLKWVGLAGLAYIIAMWFNSVFRWFDQIVLIGSEFLMRGATAWGFMVSLTAMSLAVVFAVPGAYFLMKNKGESVRWFGLSLLMVGVYYVTYVAYSVVSSNLDSAMQIDVWTLPFVFLGFAMLRVKIRKNLIDEPFANET